MKKSGTFGKEHVYQAPYGFVGIFYTLLVVWTVIAVVLLGSKTFEVGWPIGQLLMIAFVLAYTWYFSLGIAYKIILEANGELHLKSIRREITVHAKTIPFVEAPRLAILPYGFVRFRLEREKAYLFCLITDENFRRLLTALSKLNRDMALKGL